MPKVWLIRGDGRYPQADMQRLQARVEERNVAEKVICRCGDEIADPTCPNCQITEHVPVWLSCESEKPQEWTDILLYFSYDNTMAIGFYLGGVWRKSFVAQPCIPAYWMYLPKAP